MQSFRIGQQSKGVIAASILSVALGCTSADDKAMQEGFVRNGEKAAAPAEPKEEPKTDQPAPTPAPAPEPEQKDTRAEVSPALFNFRSPNWLGSNVRVGQVEGIDVYETTTQGRVFLPIPSTPLYVKAEGQIAYQGVKAPTGFSDGVIAGGEFAVGYLPFNKDAKAKRLFGESFVGFGIQGGYKGANFDGADLKNTKEPYLGAHVLAAATVERATLQLSTGFDHNLGATEERRRGLHGDNDNWLARFGGSLSIADTVGDGDTTLWADSSALHVRSAHQGWMNDSAPYRSRTQGVDHSVSGGVLQGIGPFQLGAGVTYTDSDRRYHATTGFPSKDSTQRVFVQGVAAVNLWKGFQLSGEVGVDVKDSKTEYVGVRFGWQF